MTNHELWQAALGEIELTLSKANFSTWFKNTFISSHEGGQVVISVPNTFTKAWLEKKYNVAIIKSLQNVCPEQVKEILYRVDVRPMNKLTVDVAASGATEPGPEPAVAVTTREAHSNIVKKEYGGDGKLNPKYVFDAFVVGKGNELAHAAAIAVAKNLGTKYNPLFIYGGVGLGKTHLLQAIGNETLRAEPDARVMYVTCEKFTNEFIHAVKNGRAKEFKDTYRNVDLLMIDDVQFLTGKDGTQEEFFHTFNALHESNRQIVMTSDRPPKQIPALEHRLVSRFEWGMTADISSPDLETRIAILETKCKERNYDLDQEIVRYIASVIQSNVRELEGALNKIIAFHQFKNVRPSLDAAKSLLSSFGQASPGKKSVNAKHIVQTVSQYFEVSVQDILGPCREKRLSFPRQIIMFLMREEIGCSFPAIGNEIGGRDHTTAMHACDKIRRELEENAKLRQDIDLVKQRIYNT
jgi:chromosomal replication initiator protein